MKKTITGLLCAMAVFALASSAPADDRGKKDKDLKRVTIVLKYADGHAMEQLLQPYLTKRGRVRFERRSRALTLVDSPEVVDIMLKMVKRFDVRAPQIEFSLTLVLAETVSGRPEVPKELKSVSKQLKEVFNYNQFTIMDKAYISVEANHSTRQRVGGDKGYTVEMETQLIQGTKPTIRLEFHLFEHEVIKHIDKGVLNVEHTMIRTVVEMENGETAILGASKINGHGKALITIVNMKLN
jgi:type II/III secretion system protein